MSTLPYRMSEKAFRRFQRDIATAVTIYPEVMELSPDDYGMAPSTLEPRFRDALKSLFTYRWATDLVNMSKFIAIYNDLVVSHPGEKIFVGSRAKIRELSGAPPSKSKTSAPTLVELPSAPAIPSQCIDLANEVMKRTLCEIASKGQGGPFRVKGLTSADVKSLEESYDVRIDDNQDGTFTIS